MIAKLKIWSKKLLFFDQIVGVDHAFSIISWYFLCFDFNFYLHLTDSIF